MLIQVKQTSRSLRPYFFDQAEINEEGFFSLTDGELAIVDGVRGRFEEYHGTGFGDAYKFHSYHTNLKHGKGPGGGQGSGKGHGKGFGKGKGHGHAPGHGMSISMGM